ncbi:MAG TPA: Fe-S cluster assembly protein SufD [Candidatus Binatia bacterium]|nr:Fe-S cluster assembly protein SufD [Candidatus Binatia bacterium]
MNPSETLAPPRSDSLRVGALNQGEIAAWSKRVEEPEFLARRRAAAWAHCEKTPFPARTEELWRRTDIRSLSWDQVLAARELHPVVGSVAELPETLRGEIGPREERSALLVQLDSNAILIERDPELLKRGVVVMPVLQAAREHPALVEKFLGRTVRTDESRFTALAAALESGGAFVYVPEGVSLERPIQLIFSRETPEAGTFPHVVIALGDRAEAAVIEEYVSHGEPGVGVNVGATEVTVGQGASLRLATFQRWSGNVYHFGTERVRIGRDARFHWTYTALGGKLTKVDLEMHLDGEGSEAKFSGCYFGNGTQHFDFHTFQNHNVGHSVSDLLFKGALRDRARMVYQGLIKVHKDAQRSDAYQANRNLLLSEKARADSIPSLEIEANDVRCTHGATVGQVDEEQLFYLRSRGLPRPEAEQMIIQGFFEPVLERIPAESLRTAVTAAVERKAAA